jgi:hypothetical protein
MGKYTRSPANAARLAASRVKATETVTLTSTEAEPVTFEVAIPEPEVTYVASVFSSEPIPEIEIQEGVILEEAVAQEIEVEEVKENSTFSFYRNKK